MYEFLRTDITESRRTKNRNMLKEQKYEKYEKGVGSEVEWLPYVGEALSLSPSTVNGKEMEESVNKDEETRKLIKERKEEWKEKKVEKDKKERKKRRRKKKEKWE